MAGLLSYKSYNEKQPLPGRIGRQGLEIFGSKLFDQFLLCVREGPGHPGDDDEIHMAPVAALAAQTVARQTDPGLGLGSRRNLDLLDAFEGWNFKDRAESHLREGDFTAKDEVIPLALIKGMVLENHGEEKIAGLCSPRTGLALAGEAQALSRRDALRNLDLDLFGAGSRRRRHARGGAVEGVLDRDGKFEGQVAAPGLSGPAAAEQIIDVKAGSPAPAGEQALSLGFDLGRVGRKAASCWLMLAYDDLYSIQFMGICSNCK